LNRGPLDLAPHQQTMRSAIQWSYDLLSEAERAVFRRLSIFVGGCTLDAAEAICQVDDELPITVLDGVEALIDSSLLQHEEAGDGESRYLMLETIREYALERALECGEEPELCRRHAAYYLRLAEQAEPELTGPRQDIWLKRLEREHVNLHAALRWALDDRVMDIALRMGAALWRFWCTHGHLGDGYQLLKEALELAESNTQTSPPQAVWAEAFNGAAGLSWARGDLQQARLYAENSLSISRDMDDTDGIAEMLNCLGVMADQEGDYAQARRYYEQSLALHEQIEDTLEREQGA
jgi:tetratricopeptide (TPR) repeat protein